MVILFTSADMSAFVVAAEEQNEVASSDGSSDSNEISSEIQKMTVLYQNRKRWILQ